MIAKKTFFGALAVSIFASILYLVPNASAAGYDRHEILKKALLQGYYSCATGGYVAAKFNSIGDYPGTIRNKDKILTSSVLLPSGMATFGHNSKAGKINCQEVLEGKVTSSAGINKSVFSEYNHPAPAKTDSEANKRKWLIRYGGYREVSTSTDTSEVAKEKCFQLRYVLYYSGASAGNKSVNVTTDPFCLSLGGDDKVIAGSIDKSGTGWQNPPDSTWSKYNAYYDESKGLFQLNSVGIVSGAGGIYYTNWPGQAKVKGKTYEEAKNEIINAMEDARLGEKMPGADKAGVAVACWKYDAWAQGDLSLPICNFVPGYNRKQKSWQDLQVYIGLGTREVINETEKNLGESTTSKAYEHNDDSGDAFRGVAYLSGYSADPPGDAYGYGNYYSAARNGMYLTTSERIQVYMDYLASSELYDAGINCAIQGSEENKIKFFSNGDRKIKTCYIGNYNHQKDKALNAIKYDFNSALHGFEGTISFDELVAFFNNLPDGYELDFDPVVPRTTDIDPHDTDEYNKAAEADAKEAAKNCYDSAGANNWIACPIIDNGTSASERMYAFIEGMLQVNTLLFTTNDGANGTFDAWGSFRNFANIAFIIVFVVVVLSQVTGFGIDNYGIKKILPKLILGALLVNISYFVCQAAVDAANITGGGLKELFQAIEGGLTRDKAVHFAFGTNKVLAGVTVLNAASILGGIVAAAWYFSGGGILVPIILGVIGIVIGIIFFLVLLAVRQGLAVILVVISPLAFVAYMLPNTKSLFSKWLKLLSATLLAYPICSLAVYGGQMVSTIILVGSAKAITEGLMVTNFALALTSAILSIAPVFFIPTLITKSMSGISTVANGLKARANSLGRGAFDRSHTAENMRNVSAAKKENMNVARARRTKAALEDKRRENGGLLSIADRARLRTAQNTIAGQKRKNADLYAGMAETMSNEQLVAFGQEAFGEDGSLDKEKLLAAMSRLNQTSGEKEAYSLLFGKDTMGKYWSLNQEGQVAMRDIYATQGGNSVGRAVAKLLTKSGVTKGGLEENASLFKNIVREDMGDDFAAKMTKDEFEFLSNTFSGKDGAPDLNGLFNGKQLASAAAVHNSGKANALLNGLIGGLNNDELAEIRNKMNASEYVGLSEDSLAAMNFQKEDFERLNGLVSPDLIGKLRGAQAAYHGGTDADRDKVVRDTIERQEAAAKARAEDAARRAANNRPPVSR